jgi:hypothetical protein
VEKLQSWFREVRASDVSANALLDRCDAANTELEFVRTGQDSSSSKHKVGRLEGEFLAFCLFAATLLEFFSDDRPSESFREVAERTPAGCPIDVLAEARQAFSVHPRAAWDAVARFRVSHNLSNTAQPVLIG